MNQSKLNSISSIADLLRSLKVSSYPLLLELIFMLFSEFYSNNFGKLDNEIITAVILSKVLLIKVSFIKHSIAF